MTAAMVASQNALKAVTITDEEKNKRKKEKKTYEEVF
jgi:hypothetical protein